MPNKQPNFRFVDLSWAVVGLGENALIPFDEFLSGIDTDAPAVVERYAIGYLDFWQIAFVDVSQLQPCHDEQLRQSARRKITRHIAEHPPMEPLPRFYLVLLRQSIAPMEEDGMSRVYQV